jgi:hypothetical protein
MGQTHQPGQGAFRSILPEEDGVPAWHLLFGDRRSACRNSAYTSHSSQRFACLL